MQQSRVRADPVQAGLEVSAIAGVTSRKVTVVRGLRLSGRSVGTRGVHFTVNDLTTLTN